MNARRVTRPPQPASLRGIGAAIAALRGEGETPSTEDALAQREQWRAADEARRKPQGVLPL